MAINPYRPPDRPTTESSGPSRLDRWHAKLKNFARSLNHLPQSLFQPRLGVICCGIAYFVDDEDKTLMIAACPSTSDSPQRLQLVTDLVEETICYLIEDYPHMRNKIETRDLRIDLVENYVSPQKTIRSSTRIAANTVCGWLANGD